MKPLKRVIIWLIYKVGKEIQCKDQWKIKKGKYNIINGNLNLLWLVVLMSYIMVADTYDLNLA